MALFFELLEILLAAFGLVCILWLLYGHMVLPVGRGSAQTTALVLAAGEGADLEHTVTGLRWLRRCGLWRGTIVIRDCGLTPEGRAAAMSLAMEPGIELDRSGPVKP